MEAATAFARRGACPQPFAPMQTGDGLLARLSPAPKAFSLEAFADLCAAARKFGNGIVEVTARSNPHFFDLAGRRHAAMQRTRQPAKTSGTSGPGPTSRVRNESSSRSHTSP